MAPIESIFNTLDDTAGFVNICKGYKDRAVMELSALSGSAFAFYAAGVVRKMGGVHIFICADRDAAAYTLNDLYALVGERDVLFFPTGYKRSIRFGQEDPSGIVQRTAALEALEKRKGERLVICTYPEAMMEMVVSREVLSKESLEISVGQRVEMATVEERIVEFGFQRVDFVYEPGQYSMRGGIMDIFSFAENKPYRIDFFGDEVESIRRFDITSQLSTQKLESINVVPNFKSHQTQQSRCSFAEFAGDVAYWVDDLTKMLSQMDSMRKKFLSESSDPKGAAEKVTSASEFLRVTEGMPLFSQKECRQRPATLQERFSTSPQPAFNKQYEILAQDVNTHAGQGYTTYILSENKAQIERLENVFASIGQRSVQFTPLSITLHEGFIDNAIKACFYTDHQIFDRYHRYTIKGEIDKSQSLTVAELNELKVGDFVVHIDHGVGRFGGLVKSMENGKHQEAVKLVYRDNDVIFVNVHALHRISRYKSKDSEKPPKVNKLGTGAWQKMKEATKNAVKDIARELIQLYAKRKASGGFSFSRDSYLQNELAGSFPYEETEDQQKAMDLVRDDMESSKPMDRLVCGDVGFGKTEVAVRAAFKAVCDSKQVAVLVPTTILAFQHYRTFSSRMRGLPARIEVLSRMRSAKETREIMADVEAGKIDILVGTQKILNKELKYKDLGLLIIDEEQKFGVAAKEKLRQMSVSVDTLTLTATPIPRTLQFSLMGARDLSIIATPPPNRQPIITESHIFDEEIIKEAIEFELARGGQVYYLHNKVSDIESTANRLRGIVPNARIMIGHGQMPAAKLEKLIMDFIYGEYDILLATTIIENGIDIPNANTIIIDDAHNFGLSELHQLRGRVGRSNKKSFCYLLSPPNEKLSSDARRRLRAIEEYSDLGAGFNIAMQDLDIRGAGNLLGAQQSGYITDMGFETYQKILKEAVAELRAEGVEGVDEIAPSAGGVTSAAFVTDCQIETDMEAILPDAYVGQSSEKLRLYRELDSINDEAGMERFMAELKDRFGELPESALRLMDVVRLRWRCIALGFEKAKLKNGLMLLQFPGDAKSLYYKSELFYTILQYAADHPAGFLIRQNNNKTGLTVRNIKDIKQACELMDKLLSESAKEK